MLLTIYHAVAPLAAHWHRIYLPVEEAWVLSLAWERILEDEIVAHFCILLGFPGGSEVKASACNAGVLGSIPGSGRSPGKGNGNPLRYSCLENPMDAGAWWATVHRVTKSRTRLSDFTSVFLPGEPHGQRILRTVVHEFANSQT